MIPNRFTDELIFRRPQPSQHALAGFLAISVAAEEQGQALPLPWLYQHLYQKAMQVQPAPKWRDLFAVMN